MDEQIIASLKPLVAINPKNLRELADDAMILYGLSAVPDTEIDVLVASLANLANALEKENDPT